MKHVSRPTPAQGDVIMHLVLDLSVGLGWLTLAAHRTASAGFAPARSVFSSTPFYPMRVWGFILLCLAVPFLVGAVFSLGTTYAASRMMLTGYWAFWAGISMVAFLAGDASPWGPMMSLLWAIRSARLPVASPWTRNGN